jgi:hypothetical protein
MSHERKSVKLVIGLRSVSLAGWLLAGCSQTAAPTPNIMQRVQGETPAPPPPSGFLGSDYSLLTHALKGATTEEFYQMPALVTRTLKLLERLAA